jgi:glycosyltransferase involved in cell wall biosynthesis
MTKETPRQNPKVSVIIPTYNRAHLVSRAIHSVLNQTYQRFEIIVVDDGSTDKSEEAIRSFKDSRIRHISHIENKGGAAARNTGIKAAKGHYIAFLDSDDEWFPSKIEKQLEVLRKADRKFGAVGTGRIIHYGNTGRTEAKIPTGRFGNIYEKLLKGKSFPGGTPTIMIKRECFERIGLFDESLESSQEYDLYIRMAKEYHFDVLREPLVTCNLFESHSISADEDAQVQGAKKLLMKYANDMPRISLLRGQFNFRIGIALSRKNQITEGRKHLLSAVLSYPYELKYWANFLLSILPWYEYLLFERSWLRR